ncbi:hypothetical protein GH714_028449 [Hevea brasiliensis]|uniref:ABCC10-like N-terminal domain-containing protein n=1 Tax=Hevea brasiliensis TaxID=3981 RepID=A0A6A6MET5_HEVBR|nr:hypothetical protein GH714_028449 [Hevea brasiliensis]
MDFRREVEENLYCLTLERMVTSVVSGDHMDFCKGISIKGALDVLSFPGAILLLFCVYKGCKEEETDESEPGFYAPLTGDEASGISKTDFVVPVTLFAKASFFSSMSFWWLNPLMKKGREKTLVDEDIPKLRETDRAESCYLLFLEQLNKQKQAEPSLNPHSCGQSYYATGKRF